MSRNAQSIMIPAGTYFLGDPCYVVPDELWSPLLDATRFFEDDPHILFQGKYNILAFSTAYGDGCFRGSDGKDYGVDAGMIGLVETTINPAAVATDYTSIVTFDRPTQCTRDLDGTLTFGDVVIPTGDTDDSDWDDEDFYDDSSYEDGDDE